jgi:uncharacterized protein YciI
MSVYLHRLIPPRPTFSADMTAEERDIMGRHVAYWTKLLEKGVAVVFGPVADPAGGWGAGITEAESEQAARDLHIDDPAVATGLCTFEVYPMPGALVRGYP